MLLLALLLDKLERLEVPPEQMLIGLQATSRYGENLYRFLESRGYQLCLLHPQQTDEFAQQRGLRAKTVKLDANTIARVLLSREARRGTVQTDLIAAKLHELSPTQLRASHGTAVGELGTPLRKSWCRTLRS